LIKKVKQKNQGCNS